MLPAPYRLRSSRQFSETIRGGRRAGSTTVVVHLLGAGSGGAPVARAGLQVSRAVGDAVTRNRVKRRLRHLLRPRLDTMPAGTRLVVQALPPSAAASGAHLARDLDACIRRLSDAIA